MPRLIVPLIPGTDKKRPDWKKMHIRREDDFNFTLCGIRVTGPRRYPEVGIGSRLTDDHCQNCIRTIPVEEGE